LEADEILNRGNFSGDHGQVQSRIFENYGLVSLSNSKINCQTLNNHGSVVLSEGVVNFEHSSLRVFESAQVEVLRQISSVTGDGTIENHGAVHWKALSASISLGIANKNLFVTESGSTCLLASFLNNSNHLEIDSTARLISSSVVYFSADAFADGGGCFTCLSCKIVFSTNSRVSSQFINNGGSLSGTTLFEGNFETDYGVFLEG
jgi:hypothetical protein